MSSERSCGMVWPRDPFRAGTSCSRLLELRVAGQRGRRHHETTLVDDAMYGLNWL